MKHTPNHTSQSTGSAQAENVDHGADELPLGGIDRERPIPSDIKSRAVAIHLRAKSGKSPKAAIWMHCLMCSDYDLSEAIKCPHVRCSYYPYRISPKVLCAENVEPTATSAAKRAGIQLNEHGQIKERDEAEGS